MATVIFKTKVGEFYEIIPNEYNIVQMQVEQEGFQYTMQDSDFVETFEEFATAFSIIEPYTFEVDDGQSVFLKSNTVGAVVINEGTAVEFVALDSRLVSVVIPHRDLWALETQMSGQTYDPEDGVIRSDGNGVQGVVSNGTFYCGEGYDNLIENQNVDTWQGMNNQNLFTTNLVNGVYEITNNGTDPSRRTSVPIIKDITPGIVYFCFNGKFETGKSITVRVEDDINNVTVNYNFDTDEFKDVEIELDLSILVNGPIDNFTVYWTGTSLNTDTIYIKENTISIFESDVCLPFVKTTAPDGRLVIQEPWTSATHTIINLDETFTEQETYINAGLINPYLKLDGVTRNTYVHGVYIYEGLLTPIEKADEIAKIQAGNYRIPQGITKPLEL